jgi:hypothetical protein
MGQLLVAPDLSDGTRMMWRWCQREQNSVTPRPETGTQLTTKGFLKNVQPAGHDPAAKLSGSTVRLSAPDNAAARWPRAVAPFCVPRSCCS